MIVRYNETTFKKESLAEGLSSRVLATVMEAYNDYLDTPEASYDEKLLMFPKALIEWCRRNDDTGNNVLVVAQLVKSRKSAGKVTPTQVLLALSIAKLMPDHALFQERMFYMGDVKPEEVNNHSFPFDVQAAVPYSPKTAVSALVLKTIVEKKDKGEDYMPLLKEFVGNFKFSRGERACSHQKFTWGYYAMNSAIRGTYTDPESEETKAMTVDLIIPLARSNADVAALFRQVEGYALATDILTHGEYLKMESEAQKLFMLLEHKASKKRARESSGRGAQQGEAAGGDLSEEEEEQNVFIYSDHGGVFPNPVDTVLMKYLEKHHGRPPNPQEDQKLEKYKLLRDPIPAWFDDLRGTRREKNLLPNAIEGVVWFIEAAFQMPSSVRKYAKPLHPDIKIVWQPDGVHPLSPTIKQKLLGILHNALFLAESKAESSIMFAYACLRNQAEVLSEAVNKVVVNRTCVDKLLDTIRVLDDPTRVRIRNSDSVYEFFYSLGWIFLRELVRKASDHWNKLLLSRNCTWQNSVSFWEKDRLKAAMYEDTDQNKATLERAENVLKEQAHRMAQKRFLLNVNGTPVFVGVCHTNVSRDATNIECLLHVNEAVYSRWGQVSTLEPDDSISKMPRIPSGNKWHKYVVRVIEKLNMYNEQVPVAIRNLIKFFEEWADDLAVAVVQIFMFKFSAQELYGFNPEIMGVLNKYQLHELSSTATITQLLKDIGDTAYVKEHLAFIRADLLRGIAYAGLLPVYQQCDPDNADSDWIMQRIHWLEVSEGQLRLNPRILHLSPTDMSVRDDEKSFHLADHQPRDPFAPRPAQA